METGGSPRPHIVPLVLAISGVVFSARAAYGGGAEPTVGGSEPAESRWLYDYGPPATYQDYIHEHPYHAFMSRLLYSTPATEPSIRSTIHTASSEVLGRFGVFVNSTLYKQISDSIAQYISDLEIAGWQALLYTTEGGLPQDVKSLIVNAYEQGLSGCILIGDIPIAWVENEADVWIDEEEAGNASQIDLYYGDLDGTWLDRDGDGLFDSHTPGEGDRAPEIWLARLYATTLDGNEVALMENYFRKNHAYREGSLTLPARALDYADDDWSGRSTALTILYDDVTLVDDNQQTVPDDYRARLAEGYSLIRLWAHSGGNIHGFKNTPDQGAGYAHCYIHSPLDQQAQLRLGSDDGIKVWWNGSNISTYDVFRPHQFDANAVEVYLKQGWNRLLIKVTDRYGACGFSARLSDRNGNDLDSLTYQLNDPSLLGHEPEFIRSWLVNGFYPQDRNWYRCMDYNYLGGEDSADPTEGHRDGDYTWMRVNSAGPYVDLNGVYPSSESVDRGISYAFVRVHSPTTQAVELWVGSDDGVKVWLNGGKALTVNEVRPWNADEDRITVTLRAGWNRLLLKISEWNGAHGFSARFAHRDGTLVPGLRYDPGPEPVRYIGDWLCNGWYKNPDDETRLNDDYLGGEPSVLPAEGQFSGSYDWITHHSPTDYVDFNAHVFAGRRGLVNHEDVIAIDPCCFFYDLWCCGTRRCNLRNYLGGWYVFTDSYGLATWGLLHPCGDFYRALAEGQCLGEAQLAYLNASITEDSYGRAGAFAMYGDPTLVPATPSASRLVYVDTRAVGSNDGSSWANAYNHLQDALAEAVRGDEIRVASGTYKPDAGLTVTAGDRTATFQLRNGVALKGGYAGTGNTNGALTDPDMRDVREFETVLSGDIGTRGVFLDNSHHVVTAGSKINGSSVLDGFTIAGGYTDESGAGLFNSGYPKLRNCTFVDNTAGGRGGGLYNHKGSADLTHCQFRANTGLRGGGVSCRACGDVKLSHCVFTGNSASQGGGFYGDYSTVALSNCAFTANSATWGGAIFSHSETGTTVSNCILWNDSPREIHVVGGIATVTYSNVQGGWPGEGNIDADPLFTDPSGGDFHLKSQAGRWDRASETWVVDDVTSPCIDAGGPDTPVGDEPEPNGGRVNMGAYGGTAEASKSHAPE